MFLRGYFGWICYIMENIIGLMSLEVTVVHGNLRRCHCIEIPYHLSIHTANLHHQLNFGIWQLSNDLLNFLFHWDLRIVLKFPIIWVPTRPNYTTKNIRIWQLSLWQLTLTAVKQFIKLSELYKCGYSNESKFNLHVKSSNI